MPNKNKSARERAMELMLRNANNGTKNTIRRDGSTKPGSTVSSNQTNTATTSQSTSTSQSTNSSTTAQKSSQTAHTTSQGGSQGTSYNDKFYHAAGRRYTNKRRVETTTPGSSGRGKTTTVNSRRTTTPRHRVDDEVKSDRPSLVVGGAAKQWAGGHLSGIGTSVQSDLITLNSYRDAALNSALKEEEERRQNPGKRQSSTDKSSFERYDPNERFGTNTKDGVDLTNVDRSKYYDLSAKDSDSETYKKIISGTRDMISKGDELIDKGTADIEQAKEGLGSFGQFAVDTGAQMTQWGMDAMFNAIPVVGQAISMSGFMNRAGGMAASQARKEGWNPDQQYMYQFGSALAEGISELTFQSVGALRATYGKGMFSLSDKLVNKMSTSGIVQRLLKSTPIGKSLAVRLAQLGGGALEEGLEEVQTDLVDPLLRYLIKKQTDPKAEFEGYDFKQMGYDFIMGATMGGLLGGASAVKGVKADLNIKNDDAFNEGYMQTLIKQASVQGRVNGAGKALTTNAEILAEQFQKQIDAGQEIQPAQIQMLEEALGQSRAENNSRLYEKNVIEYEKAKKSGELVQGYDTREGSEYDTRMEREGMNNATEQLANETAQKVVDILGEDASLADVNAITDVKIGTATSAEIDTVLSKAENKQALETLMNEGNTSPESAISIPVNNAEARNVIEDIVAVNKMSNRNTLLKGVQQKNKETLKATVDNMNESGKELFASHAEEGASIIGDEDIYRDRFSRLYTDGNTKGADFDTSYERIIGQFDSDTLKTVFTKDFARQIFDEGRKAIITDTAKEAAKSKAEQYANRKAEVKYEKGSKKLVSSKEQEALQKFAERTGVEIKIVKTLSDKVKGDVLMSKDGKRKVINGMYDKGVITIAADSNNKLITVAKHELTHYIKETSPEMYQKLEDFVFERWYHGNAEEMEDEIARYMKLYAGQGLDRNGVREEILADASEAFFTDEGAIQDVVSYNKKLGRTIRDGIKTMLDAFLGLQDSDTKAFRHHGGFLKELDILREAERMWLDALQDSQERKRAAMGETVAEETTETEAKASLSDEDFIVKDGTARWTEDRIDSLIREYGAEHDDRYSKAYAVLMNPRQFLKLTLSDESLAKWNESANTMPEKLKGRPYRENVENVHNERLETGKWIHDNENYPLDRNELAKQKQTPFLEISSSNGTMIDGHEGRHRMRALAEAGVESVPVVIRDTDTKYTKNYVQSMALKSQDFGRGAVNDGARVIVNGLIPIKQSNRDELIEKFGGEADVKFSVSSEEDQTYLDAVNRGDMETAQRMVDEQAKSNGYNIKVFHGTPNETISASRGRVRGDDYKKLATDYADKLFPYVVFRNNGRLTGIYTSTDRGIADAFSYSFSRQGTVYDLYARADKPFTFDAEGNGWNNLPISVAEDLDISKVGRITLEDVSRSAKEQGYDAVVVNNVRETGSGDNESPLTTDVIVFNSNQLKSADPVTYDDNGNVIPLSERFNEKNEDIRYSLSTDSDGNKLTKAQDEYFKDSKVRDKNGNLLVMYHGTNNDFFVFDFSQGGKNGTALGYGIYMSPRSEESQMYGDRLIKSYVNMEKPVYDNKKSIKPSALKKFIKATAEHEARLLVNDEGYDSLEDAIKDTWVSNYEYTYDKPMSDVYTNVANSIIKRNKSDMDIIQECIMGMGIYNYESIPTVYNILTETMGIDGFVTTKDGKDDVVLAFRSNQIKTVENENPTDNADIRYSIEDRDDIEAVGVNVTEGGSATKFSVESWDETNVTELRQKLIDAGNDPKAVDKWINDVNSVSANIIRNKLRYDADRTHSALKNNSEYYYTLDLSTLCAKRKLYQGTFNAIMHSKGMENVTLLPKDLIHLRALMAQMGYEVPCGICYEESRKKNEPKFAKQWLFGYKTKTTEWAGYANMEHNDPYIPTLADVLTTDGRSMLQAEHPEVLEAYLTFQKGRGSANPKVSRLHTDYRGEILGMTESEIEKVKEIGGLRIQSFSDFEIPHILDMMQVVLDMSAMKLTSQAYTKVPAFARVFGNTGIKINLSLIVKTDENGKIQYETYTDENGVERKRLLFDSKEGIDPDEAFELRELYENNVGTIVVGADRESILAAWADPRIDMVIPFHRSGWSKSEFKALGLGGYEDFQAYQTERFILNEEQAKILTQKDKENPKKKKPHTYKAGETVTLAMARSNGFTESKDELYSNDYWDRNLSGKENAEKYLQLCAEQHRRPVFYEFLQDNGDGSWSLKDDGSTDGYWKSLIDFKMYKSDGTFAEQRVVEPNFNMDAATGVVDTFEGDPDNLPVANDVVDQFVKDYKGGRKYKLASDKKIADKDLPKIDKSKLSLSEDSEAAPTTKEYRSTVKKLEEQVSDLKAEFKRTNLKTADPKQVRIQAGRFLKRHDANNSLHGEVVDAFNKIFGLYKEKGTDAFDEVYEIAQKTAVDVVNSISVIHDEGAEDYKAIKDYLKNTEIKVSDEMKRNITDYNDFRKHNFGRLKLVNGETSNIDNVYMELMEMFPGQFTEDYVNPADQLYHIVDVLDNYAPYYETLDGASEEMQDYVVEIASDIMETAYNLQTKKTFADKKYEEKVRAVKKAREEALASRKKALNRQKQRYEEKIEALKQHNKDYKAETRENAEKRRRIKQISNVYKRLLQKLQTPSDTKHLPDGYAPIVTKVLSMFDFTTGIMRWAGRHAEPSKRYKEMTNTMLELRKQLEQMSTKEGSELEVDPDLLDLVDEIMADMEDGQRLVDMDSKTLEDISVLFRAFEHQMNTYNKAFDENNKKATSETAHSIFNDLDKIGDGKGKWKLGVMGRLLTSNFNPSDFFELLGGDVADLYNATRKGFDKYVDRLDNAKTFLQDRVDNKKADKWANHVATYKTSSGEDIELTDTQLMSLYCLNKREQAQGHIYGGGIVSAPLKVKNMRKLIPKELEKKRVIPSIEDVGRWFNTLTDEQKQVANDIQRYFVDEVSAWGNETSMKLYNYKKFGEPNYFPIQSSSDYRASNFDQRGEDPVLKNMGMTKNVVKNANNVIVIDDIFTVFSKHVAQMASYNAYVPAITDFQRVWNYTEGNDQDMVKARFERVYGRKAADYIENFFKNLNGVYKANFDPTIFDKGLGLFKKAAVGGNIRVLVQQPTAIARSALLINPAYLTAAVPLATAHPKQAYRDMMEHCPIARWKTWGFYSSDITSASRDLKNIMIGKDALTDKIFMNMYGTADNVTWTVIFKACQLQVEAQNKGLEKGSDEYWEKVNDLASRVFDRTQVVDSPFHRSELMKSQDGLVKAATAFMAEPTKTINMLNTELTKAMTELKNGHPQKALKIFTRVGLVITANAAALALAQAMVDAMRHAGGDDDKDKGDYGDRFKNYWKANFGDNLNPFGMIPYIKDIKSLWDGYDVLRLDMNGVQKIIKSIQYVQKYYEDPAGSKYSAQEEWTNLALNVLYTVGVPISNVKRDIEGLYVSIMEGTGHPEVFFDQARRKYQLNSKTQSSFIDMYYDALQRNDNSTATKIHTFLIKGGVSEEDISGRVNKQKRENKSDTEQQAYDRSMKILESSSIWKKASENNKEYYTGVINNLSVGVENKNTEYVTKLAKNGLTNEQVILYKLALKQADANNNNNGGYDKDEKAEALRMLMREYNLTEAQKNALQGK